jgi:hypothetical protein
VTAGGRASHSRSAVCHQGRPPRSTRPRSPRVEARR